jgi:hypothetical protein
MPTHCRHRSPDPYIERRRTDLRERIARCGQQLERYRAGLESQPDIGDVVGRWIAEVHAERRRLEIGTKAAGFAKKPSETYRISFVSEDRHKP